MIESGVWKAIDRKALLEGAKIITSTWACKKKSNEKLRGGLNARGFQQVQGKHYDPSSIAAPVANDTMIHIVMVLMILAGWIGWVVDIKGAFMKGKFESGEEIYMEVPEGMEHHYGKLQVLRLLKPIHGLKQASM